MNLTTFTTAFTECELPNAPLRESVGFRFHPPLPSCPKIIGSYTASTGFARFPGTYSYRTQVSNPAAALVSKAENYLDVYGFLRFYVRLSMAYCSSDLAYSPISAEYFYTTAVAS